MKDLRNISEIILSMLAVINHITAPKHTKPKSMSDNNDTFVSLCGRTVLYVFAKQ